MRWYVNRKGITEGPFEEPVVIEMVRRSKDMRFAAFREEESAQWMKFEASPFASAAPANWNYVSWKQSLVVVGGLVAVLAYLNHTDKYRVRTPDTAPSASNSPAGVSPSLPNDDDAAFDTANAIRTTYGAFCDIGTARAKWDRCHDHTKGYAAILKCAQEASGAANAATSPTPKTSSTCGHDVVAATGTIVRGVRLYLTDTVTWLKSNAPTLKSALASKSLHEACDDIDCSSAPTEGSDGKYASASFLPLNMMECTQTLFQCGASKNGMCTVAKVAARLGAACDDASDMTDDPLYVRSTGTRIH